MLLPSLALMLAAGDPRPESEVSDTVKGPVAVSLDRLNPSQKELIEELLAEADREPMNGLTKGKHGMAYAHKHPVYWSARHGAGVPSRVYC